jgi:hypothetical protein
MRNPVKTPKIRFREIGGSCIQTLLDIGRRISLKMAEPQPLKLSAAKPLQADWCQQNQSFWRGNVTPDQPQKGRFVTSLSNYMGSATNGIFRRRNASN